MGVMPSPATGKKPNSISLALARGEELKKDMNLYEPCSVTIHSSVLRFIRTIPAALVLLLLYTFAAPLLAVGVVARMEISDICAYLGG
jgi:hypothetical protein